MRSEELRDLVISALVLALAFGIALSGGYQVFDRFQPARLVTVFFYALIGVSSGFVLHELGHRYVARRFGCFAEYTMWPTGLAIALALSIFGFVFAAPGAVMIYPSPLARLTRKNEGLISLSGPAMNFLLALVFILLDTVSPLPVFFWGARINAWMGVFNLIPFGPLDGGKILRWNIGVWVGALVVGVGLLFWT